MLVEARHPRIGEIIDAEQRLEVLATGFRYAEGPVWDAGRGRLVFSDIPGDRMLAWRQDTGVSIYRRPSGMANGNCLGRDGRLFTCEHATSSVVREERDGGRTVLASHFEGVELNSPNDIVERSDGLLFFSDPTYGRGDHVGVPRPQHLPFQGVFSLRLETRSLTLLADDFVQPNGLCLSLDERRLFVNDSERFHIRVFDVAPSGRLSGGAVWAETSGKGEGSPDGMKIDAGGNIYCCAQGGVQVFDGAGLCLGVILVPEEVGNCAFGDDDRRSLFITASTSLYRVRLRIPGA